MLEHPVFTLCLNDSTKPKYFRDAGQFRGIAPGTPAPVVRERVGAIDNTLPAALGLLDERKIEQIVSTRRNVSVRRIA